MSAHQDSAVEAVSARLLAEMRRIARQDGWAISLHGSMARDLDVVAVPWIEGASDEAAFVEAMRAAVARELRGLAFIGAGDDRRNPGAETKPHGRRSWTIHGLSDQLVESENGAHPYVDLAVMDFRTTDTTLSEQRDELLEALEAADKALKYYEWYNNPASGWALPENEHVRGKVEAALTKVRGS